MSTEPHPVPPPGAKPPGGRPLVSLVICTLDEAQTIGPVLREARQALAEIDYEIIVVDDSVDDWTAAAVLAQAVVDPHVRLIRRRGARGLASAAIAGWDAAEGDVLAIMDGDGQHETGLLPQMLSRLAQGDVEMVIASRYLTQGPSGLDRRRDLMSRLATLAARLTLGAAATDPMSGFFMMRRSWYDAVRGRLSAVGFKVLADLMASGRRAPRTAELRASLRPRAGGVSKLDARVVVELAALLVEKRSGGLIPTRFTLFASVGATGLVVQLSILEALHLAAGTSFWAAQALAIFCAMTWNFFLNNALTFRDLRLTGRRMLKGLGAFYLSCSGGALLSEGMGALLHHLGAPWAIAGAAGAFAAALWNYWSSAGAAWRARPAAASAPPQSDPAAAEALAPPPVAVPAPIRKVA